MVSGVFSFISPFFFRSHLSPFCPVFIEVVLHVGVQSPMCLGQTANPAPRMNRRKADFKFVYKYLEDEL